jgi:hypothetical protein
VTWGAVLLVSRADSSGPLVETACVWIALAGPWIAIAAGITAALHRGPRGLRLLVALLDLSTAIPLIDALGAG